MYIQSGVWVIISRFKSFFENRYIKSLRFRIVLLLILVGVVPSIITKSQVISGYEERAVNVKNAEIKNQCTILCNHIGDSDYLETGVSEIVEAELNQLAMIYNGRVMIIDDGFRITEDTYDLETGKTIVSENVIRASLGAENSYYDAEAKYIEVAAPIKDGNGTILGVMLVSVSTDTIAATMELLNTRANVILAIVIFVVLVAAIFLGTMMVRPFGRITKSIEAITEGYEDHYLHENAYTETVLISDAFNKLQGRLKLLDDSRNEFVSNVSHELKTPLTSMKVLADSLLMQKGAPVELYEEFMADMSAEIERENKIINDLLTLVKSDKTAADLDVQQENINELLERVLKRLRPIAEGNKVELILESFRPVNGEVDEVKFSLAITNLVENAIKYNNENGWVKVSLNADHKYFYVEIADSGIGIPKDSLDHIFERFYRVDKSHSREIGGTGLGLSITKNIVIMHKGAIKVRSQFGEGTTFTVRIPINYVT